MRARLERLAAWLDGLGTQERVLLASAGFLLVGMLWHRLLLAPLAAEEQRLEGRIAAARTRAADADLEAVRVVEAAQRDPDAALRERLAAADAGIAEFEAEIRERAGQLVPPAQMARILRSVLEQTRGLEFVGLEGLGSKPLLENDGDVDGMPGVNAYRHGFRIRFRGSYLETLAYLRALEALPWRFFWDAVELEVTEHPEALAAVVVYTLSLERGWIGV